MSVAEAQEVRSRLLEDNEQYRQLAERHHELDDRLHQLTARPYLSDDEQIEEVRIKKRKLALKDEMERIARDFMARSRTS